MSSSNEIDQNYCWNTQNSCRSINKKSSTPPTQVRPFSSSVCSKTSRRSTTSRLITSPKPTRQSENNNHSSPLHVAAFLANAARAAITGTDSLSFLCAHPNIVDTFEGCFETADENLLFFVQEPIICNTQTLRDLLNANPGGLCENTAKAILSKVIAAIEFIHSESLVHRAIRAENIIVGDPRKFTKVKLTELGSVRTVDSIIRHTEIAGPYHAPELCERVPNETFSVAKQTDIWALAILIAYCMKGKFPWQKATIMCKPFYEWDQWLKRKAVQQPKYWDSFADKAMRMFKHSLNPKPKERWDIRGIRKFIEKERLSKSKTSSEDDVYYPDEGVGTRTIEGKQTKKTSTIGQWINNTLNTMSEISEQVVSARDDD